jgi:hypothetical protein
MQWLAYFFNWKRLPNLFSLFFYISNFFITIVSNENEHFWFFFVLLFLSAFVCFCFFCFCFCFVIYGVHYFSIILQYLQSVCCWGRYKHIVTRPNSFSLLLMLICFVECFITSQTWKKCFFMLLAILALDIKTYHLLIVCIVSFKHCIKKEPLLIFRSFLLYHFGVTYLIVPILMHHILALKVLF